MRAIKVAVKTLAVAALVGAAIWAGLAVAALAIYQHLTR
jgi:hypothetical protein